jgi:hypothetical protein
MKSSAGLRPSTGFGDIHLGVPPAFSPSPDSPDRPEAVMPDLIGKEFRFKILKDRNFNLKGFIEKKSI